jgi:transcriptional regulator with XRE-family HTH domain
MPEKGLFTGSPVGATLRSTMEGKQLAWRRRRLGWTQQEMAKALGVARNTVARYELGLMKIPKAMALAIESVYETNLKEKGGE